MELTQYAEPLGGTGRVERDGLEDTLADLGIGSIAFTPLAQGLLTRKYLAGIFEESRAAQNSPLDAGMIIDDMITALKGLNGIAEARIQSQPDRGLRRGGQQP